MEGESGRRWPATVVVLLVTMLAVAPFVAFSLLIADSARTGCFLQCDAPRPNAARVWYAVAVVVGLLPVLAAVVVHRRRINSRARWIFVGKLALAFVPVYLIMSSLLGLW